MIITTDTINTVNTLFTRENITLLIAIAGFIGTVLTWAIALIRNRKKISIDILDYVKRAYATQLFVRIQNHSSAPLSIHSISITNKTGDTFPCELIPKPIRGYGPYTLESSIFPINLAPKQGYQCFLEFLFCEDIHLVQGKTVDLLIHSNRGPVNKSLILGSPSHYLHNKE